MILSDVETFLCAAKCHSFMRAADQLCLSPNAVKKRIGQLENELGIILFTRSTKGICLTAAGEYFFDDCQKFMKNFKQSVEKSRQVQAADSALIKIGCMDTFADSFLTTRWSSRAKAYKTHLTFYGTSLEDRESMFRDVGQKTDLAVDVYDERLAAQYNLKALKITDEKIHVGICEKHRLYGKSILSPEDLAGETLLILQQGRSGVWDDLRAQFQKDYPKTLLEEVDTYGLRTFHKCESEEKLALLIRNWEELYPSMHRADITLDYRIPFGIYYAPASSAKVQDFISAISQI